jgi:hypothetical protein
MQRSALVQHIKQWNFIVLIVDADDLQLLAQI